MGGMNMRAINIKTKMNDEGCVGYYISDFCEIAEIHYNEENGTFEANIEVSHIDESNDFDNLSEAFEWLEEQIYTYLNDWGIECEFDEDKPSSDEVMGVVNKQTINNQ
jgi:hypothetical protein